MQEQQIHKVLSQLSEGSPVELVKGVVIGYDTSGRLRMYNADMSQEELIVACELTKARALGLVHKADLSSAVAAQLASRPKDTPETLHGSPQTPVTPLAPEHD